MSWNRHVYVDRHRVSVEGHGDTYNLLVRNVQQWDDGRYTCQVPGPHPISQTSRLIVSSKFELMLRIITVENPRLVWSGLTVKSFNKSSNSSLSKLWTGTVKFIWEPPLKV